MILRVLDPTNERTAIGGQPAPRPVSLKGKTIGFISNGKEGTAGFFAHLDRMLRDEFGVADVVFRRKVELQRAGRRRHRRRDQKLARRRHRRRRLRQLLIVQSARLHHRRTARHPRHRRDDGAIRQRRRDDGEGARHAGL